MSKYYHIICKKRDALESYLAQPKLRAYLEKWLYYDNLIQNSMLTGSNFSEQEIINLIDRDIVSSNNTLKEHIAITNYAKTLRWACSPGNINEIDEALLKDIHRMLSSSLANIARGTYRNFNAEKIKNVAFTLPKDIPLLIADTLENLHLNANVISKVSYLMQNILSIRPFVEYNEQVSNVLINYLLTCEGFPILTIDHGKLHIIYKIMGCFSKKELNLEAYVYAWLEDTIDLCLHLCSSDTLPALPFTENPTLLSIGQLANKTRESISTIKYWSKQGLLPVERFSPQGTRLYCETAITKISRIKNLKKQHYQLKDIRKIIQR